QGSRARRGPGRGRGAPRGLLVPGAGLMAVDAPELLRIERLVKYFPIRAGLLGGTVGHVRAVDDVSFGIRRGEAFGLVGESGCGKTPPPGRVSALPGPPAGRFRFAGLALARLGGSALRPVRRRIQMIFQDPYASLDPRMTVGAIVAEPLEVFAVGTRAQREAR